MAKHHLISRRSFLNQSTAVVAGYKNTVYVGASDGVFYALSATNGEKLWSYAVGVPIATASVAADGGIFAAS
jgi:outer membrane protein assembly factor BamB